MRWIETALALLTPSAIAALLTVMTIALAMPWFRRYALARPDARSSHRVPTPQGGGAAVILATLVAGLAASHLPLAPGLLALAVLVLAVLGGIDDIRPLSWRLRLGVQIACVALVLIAFPHELRLVPALPLGLERGLALLLGLWFVNLVNFMDGIDGMLVVGIVPLALVIGSGFMGFAPPEPLALALAGALVGFFVFNRPPARIFAGDVGSLSIALLVAALLFDVAMRVSLAAALILPLYFVMDASWTLILRWRRGAVLTQAHREHAYQRAVDGGMPVERVIGQVMLLNLGLGGLACWALRAPPIALPALMTGVLATAVFILHLRRRA